LFTTSFLLKIPKALLEYLRSELFPSFRKNRAKNQNRFPMFGKTRAVCPQFPRFLGLIFTQYRLFFHHESGIVRRF